MHMVHMRLMGNDICKYLLNYIINSFVNIIFVVKLSIKPRPGFEPGTFSFLSYTKETL